MLAARLCGAQERARLAKLPSSTVQVLGAEKAFFAHLKTGSHRRSTASSSPIRG